MLVRQLIRKHLERPSLDQTTGVRFGRHQPDLRVLEWIGLRTFGRRPQFLELSREPPPYPPEIIIQMNFENNTPT